jgi:nicotinamidase-related amidase
MTKFASALLIIDMQKGSFTEKTPRFDPEGVIERINRLAGVLRELKSPVIFIQHDGSAMGEFVKNTNEWELLDELEVYSGDILVDKYANDSFYRTELKRILEEHKIKELLITGCATDFCVESTIQSALTRDYLIKVMADGHTTGDRPHLKAEKIIEHYNWLWENMIPTKGKVEVVNTSDWIKGI